MDTSMIPTNFMLKRAKVKVTLTGGNVETYLWGNQLKDSINLGEYSPELDDNGMGLRKLKRVVMEYFKPIEV